MQKLRTSSSQKPFKIGVLKNVHRKTPALEYFKIKLQAFKLATLLKRDSNTGVFL